MRFPASFPARPVAGLLLAGLATAFVAAPAVAADPPAKPAAKPAAKPPARTTRDAPKPREPLLTREQLQACSAQQERVRTTNAEATRMQAELEREKGDLMKEGEDLKTLLGTVDRSDAAAVEAYNARATERDRRIDAFEPRVKAFNEKVEAVNADRAAFVRDCENKRYDEKDEKALQQRK